MKLGIDRIPQQGDCRIFGVYTWQEQSCTCDQAFGKTSDYRLCTKYPAEKEISGQILDFRSNTLSHALLLGRIRGIRPRTRCIYDRILILKTFKLNLLKFCSS